VQKSNLQSQIVKKKKERKKKEMLFVKGGQGPIIKKKPDHLFAKPRGAGHMGIVVRG
jgi:hypothetical protein